MVPVSVGGHALGTGVDCVHLASQQTHQRSSISNLLRKLTKRKVTVPSPPRLLCKGGYYASGGGGGVVSKGMMFQGHSVLGVAGGTPHVP